MSVTEALRRRPAQGPTSDALIGVKGFLARRYNGRIDLDRLDGDEQSELTALIVKTRDEESPGGRGNSLAKLSRRELAKYERLVEKALALPAGQLKRERDEAELRARAAKLAARAGVRPLRREAEQTFFATIFSHVNDYRALRPRDLSVLCWVIACWSGGSCPAFNARVERRPDGPALIFDRNFGLWGATALDDDLPNLTPILEHLQTNAWLVISHAGPAITLIPGTRARRILGL